MAMLPRLQPRCFYDLVIEIAIVRPGPIQGDMVHPFLRRRSGEEAVTYPSAAIKKVLKNTLGIPIFQEQVMRLAMVAAGFSGGEADQLRRAITNWGKNSKLLLFEEKFINGLLGNGYSLEFSNRLFEQVKGFGGYGFPESHSASFALLCYASSWMKCHHPAAFYCALLNSQPMGFYSPSQLVQDARRHQIQVMPVDINKSSYENVLELNAKQQQTIRLGFREVKFLNSHNAEKIEHWRKHVSFTSLDDLVRRTELTSNDLQILASADVLHILSNNRHQSRWHVAAIQPYSEFLDKNNQNPIDDLFTPAPTQEKEILDDYRTLGLTLRQHPMTLLRNQPPFNQCTTHAQLINLRHKGFVRVAGIVTGHQRPGTANGTLFLTLEDETGNINVVVWKGTQETYRKVLLTAKLLLIKGTVEIATEQVATPVVHVIAGQLHDYTEVLHGLSVKARSFK
jgi:error-prone DNA polymerase